jgi:hypothetical protein
MCRTLGIVLGLCAFCAAPLGREVQADAIQVTFAGNAGLGSVNFTEDLSSTALETGFQALLGQRTVGPFAEGSINTPVSLTIGLSDLDAPGSATLTVSASGALTGNFMPYNLNNGDPTVEGSGTINTITISGQNSATNQLLSATIQGPNGTPSSAILAQFASISGIPQSLLSMFTTPSQYLIVPDVGGGTEGFYSVSLGIRPPVEAVAAPEPAPIAVLGCAVIAYLFKRARMVSSGFGSKLRD